MLSFEIRSMMQNSIANQRFSCLDNDRLAKFVPDALTKDDFLDVLNDEFNELFDRYMIRNDSSCFVYCEIIEHLLKHGKKYFRNFFVWVKRVKMPTNFLFNHNGVEAMILLFSNGLYYEIFLLRNMFQPKVDNNDFSSIFFRAVSYTLRYEKFTEMFNNLLQFHKESERHKIMSSMNSLARNHNAAEFRFFGFLKIDPIYFIKNWWACRCRVDWNEIFLIIDKYPKFIDELKQHFCNREDGAKLFLQSLAVYSSYLPYSPSIQLVKRKIVNFNDIEISLTDEQMKEFDNCNDCGEAFDERRRDRFIAEYFRPDVTLEQKNCVYFMRSKTEIDKESEKIKKQQERRRNRMYPGP